MVIISLANLVSRAWQADPHETDRRGYLIGGPTRERHAVAGFGTAIDALGDPETAPAATRLQVLAALRAIAGSIECGARIAPPERYGRRLLAERAAWSLAAVVLPFGQGTEPHDHGGWGAVVTVRGIERDRRYRSENGALVLVTDRDYRPARATSSTQPTSTNQSARTRSALPSRSISPCTATTRTSSLFASTSAAGGSGSATNRPSNAANRRGAR